jgi:hypothetical protein
MTEAATALAQALARRLNGAAPDHIHVIAEGSRIQVLESSGPWAMYRLEVDHSHSLEELVEGLLSGVQDDLCHATSEPWPARGSGPLPLPWATVEHGELRCGFDDVLVFEPIVLTEET